MYRSMFFLDRSSETKISNFLQCIIGEEKMPSRPWGSLSLRAGIISSPIMHWPAFLFQYELNPTLIFQTLKLAVKRQPKSAMREDISTKAARKSAPVCFHGVVSKILLPFSPPSLTYCSLGVVRSHTLWTECVHFQ